VVPDKWRLVLEARIEPILSADDVEAWDMWMRTASEHARTQAFARHVDSAKRVVDQCLNVAPHAQVSWSGGKDSTVMVHLVCVEMGSRVDVMSEKDDLDFPGEEEYVRGLGERWGLRLSVVHPPTSPAKWISEHAHEMHVGDDIHARSAGLSKACFYCVVEEANRGYDAVMLGLRSAESGMRRHLRLAKGRCYRLRNGKWRALPVADWSGLDVLAYAESRKIELLPVYRCIGLMHRDEPWRLRKSWWLPGDNSRFGQTAWLCRYYPSLYRKLICWFPHARMMI
jgi:phosphoadenosine phosphosulfate reductase